MARVGQAWGLGGRPRIGDVGASSSSIELLRTNSSSERELGSSTACNRTCTFPTDLRTYLLHTSPCTPPNLHLVS